MKKKIILTLLCLVIVILMCCCYEFFKENKEENLTTIKLAEVTHSPFYAPFYVALEKGYFKDEGLNIDLILTPGADKVSAAVLSGDVEIGFAGPESAIYIYKGGEEDYLVTFAGLTKRDGQFIISKEKDFEWKDLVGKEILVGRKGGMPALNFLNALKNAGLNEKDLNINYSIDFASLGGSFIGGIGDYVNLFEPNATKLEKEGYGYVVASIGELSGEMPYTAYYTKKSYLDDHEETLKKFNKAINNGLEFVLNNDETKTAEIILPQFKDSSLNDLSRIITRYKESDSWLANTTISEESYKNLEDLMIENNLLDAYVPFNELVKNFNE